MSILNWVRRGTLGNKTPNSSTLPDPTEIENTKEAQITAVCNAEVENVTTPRKRKRSEYGSYTPKWPVMPVFHSTHKKSTFQPKNRPRIGEGVKTSLHTWCIYYIDRVYISRFSKFRGLWQKSKEDIFLVNNGCVHNSSNGTNIDFAIGCLW